jgi:hypothetical protein
LLNPGNVQYLFQLQFVSVHSLVLTTADEHGGREGGGATIYKGPTMLHTWLLFIDSVIYTVFENVLKHIPTCSGGGHLHHQGIQLVS